MSSEQRARSAAASLPIEDGITPTNVGQTPRLCLLGGFALLVDGASAPLPGQAQRLLALLALRTDEPRSVLAGTLWAGARESRAQSNLRDSLWRVRQVCGSALRCSRQAVGLSAQLSVDLYECRRQAAAVQDGGPMGPVAELIDVLDRDLLPTWDEDWAVLERERQRQLRLHTLEELSRRLVAAGRHPEAVTAALATVGAEPLRESAQQTLIDAHLAEGNVNEAIRQFESYGRLLDHELGVVPGEALTATLRQALAARSVPTRDRPDPYCGGRDGAQ